jgi:hypothetical protein
MPWRMRPWVGRVIGHNLPLHQVSDKLPDIRLQRLTTEA